MIYLKYFDIYAQAGFKPIAVYKDTKCPVGEGWNKDWSPEKWRPYFKTKVSSYNIGLLLGDIVDVEGDSQEANDLLERMIDGFPHPKFSSSKSVHHLFLNPDPNLTRYVINDIEFRGFLHQSVVPPSVHYDVSRYNWLEDSKMPIPPMPEELLAYYWKNKPDEKSLKRKIDREKPNKRLKINHKRTHCNICKKNFYIHKKRLTLEVKAFMEYNLPWMCHSCREMDMRDACRKIRKSLDCFSF